jgi:hypothetical protein
MPIAKRLLEQGFRFPGRAGKVLLRPFIGVVEGISIPDWLRQLHHSPIARANSRAARDWRKYLSPYCRTQRGLREAP